MIIITIMKTLQIHLDEDHHKKLISLKKVFRCHNFNDTVATLIDEQFIPHEVLD